MSPTRTREILEEKHENASSGPRGSIADRQGSKPMLTGSRMAKSTRRVFTFTSVGLTRLQRKEEYLAGGARQLATTRELAGKPISYGT